MDEFGDHQGTPPSSGLTLLTGAASGIGREFARVFAANGHDLMLVDIDESGLEAVESMLVSEPGTVSDSIVVDLTDEEAIDRVDSRVRALEQPLEVLVNNAGVPVYGRFSETSFEDERRLLRLNIEAITALTDRFLPRMLERGRGRILNTASLAGVVPVPTAAVYGGSKAYVHSFSLALADELADTPVTVTALCPGETETGFMERGGMERSAVADGELMAPETVARVGYDGLMDGERVVVPGWRNRIRYRLSRLLPAWLGGRLAKRLWAGSEK